MDCTNVILYSSRSPVAYVEIEVLRTNASNAPRFTQDMYTATASEGLPVGELVTRVTVSRILFTILDSQVVQAWSPVEEGRG